LPGGKRVKGVNQDKGQEGAVGALLEAISKEAASPIPLDEILATSRTTLEGRGLLVS
jgi:hypothetical protein